ncbi:MAG: hypothetical protein IJB83_04270 [Bacilli bacterium]|nr:hypothetical protein [Bacilli bacterium]
MKKIINNYYNLYPDKIYKKEKNITYFFINNNKFNLVEIDRKKEDIEEQIKISNTLYYKNIKVNTFIKNKKNNFITTINNKNYILLKINEYEETEVQLRDIINFDKSIVQKSGNMRENMINNWKLRVDLIEKQVIEYNKEFPIIKKSINYFLGLAENAISYANNIKNEKNEKIVLSHTRLRKKLNVQTIYNPLLFIMDYNSRDVSSYLKMNYVNETNILDELEEAIFNKEFTAFEINILYSRMLYPDYYFDEIEEIIYHRKNEEKIRKIIRNIKKYEKMLIELHIMLKKYINIEPVEWMDDKK